MRPILIFKIDVINSEPKKAKRYFNKVKKEILSTFTTDEKQKLNIMFFEVFGNGHSCEIVPAIPLP